MTGRARSPRIADVLMEQVRVIGLALRRPALVGLALAAMASLVALPTIVRGGPLTINGWPTWLPGAMGALLPIVVWGRDERFGPGFLWTLPVERRFNALTKIAAGWFWLVAGVGLFLSWLLIMTVMTGESMLPGTLNVVSSMAAAARPLDPQSLRTVDWRPGPLIWLVPFSGATVTYLLASALMLGTRHPLRWVVGVVLFYLVTAFIGEPVSSQLGAGWLNDAPNRLLNALIGSRYGLDAVLTARNESLSVTATLTTGKPMRIWWGVPNLADWGVATALWAGFGGLVLWGALSRHGERRKG